MSNSCLKKVFHIIQPMYREHVYYDCRTKDGGFLPTILERGMGTSSLSGRFKQWYVLDLEKYSQII